MSAQPSRKECRNLVIVLGDQLNADSSAFDDFDRRVDTVWMAKVAEESTHVWTHKARIVMFLASMRHFRDSLRKRKVEVTYRQLDDRGNQGTLAAELELAIAKFRPKRLVVTEPGEYRLRRSLMGLAKKMKIELELRIDRHFLSTTQEFSEHANGRKRLRLEYFYRELRRKHDILVDGRQPEGGKWNYDAENRGSFGKKGPEQIPQPKRFRPDPTTKEVIELVNRKFAKHPGALDHFDWPVARQHARRALGDFIQHRLPRFGDY